MLIIVTDHGMMNFAIKLRDTATQRLTVCVQHFQCKVQRFINMTEKDRRLKVRKGRKQLDIKYKYISVHITIQISHCVTVNSLGKHQNVLFSPVPIPIHTLYALFDKSFLTECLHKKILYPETAEQLSNEFPFTHMKPFLRYCNNTPVIGKCQPHK